MLTYAADENFNGVMLRGLLRALPSLDVVRVQDTEMYEADDPDLLAWAAAEDRVLLTHDEKTIPPLAFARIDAGEPMAGVFIVPQDRPFGEMIEELRNLALYNLEGEWNDRVAFLPVWDV
jgi:hypothetical protein